MLAVIIFLSTALIAHSESELNYLRLNLTCTQQEFIISKVVYNADEVRGNKAAQLSITCSRRSGSKYQPINIVNDVTFLPENARIPTSRKLIPPNFIGYINCSLRGRYTIHDSFNEDFPIPESHCFIDRSPVISLSSNITTNINTNVTLSCTVSSYHYFNITWQKDGVVLDLNVSNECNNSNGNITWQKDGVVLDLEVSNECNNSNGEYHTTSRIDLLIDQVSQSGQYSCFIMTEMSTTVMESLYLDIQVPPTLLVSRRVTTIDNTGDSLNIDVMSTLGFPAAMFTWTHQGQPLVSDSRITVNSSSGDLVVKDVQPSDRGVYEVTASNNAGNASITVNVTVNFVNVNITAEEVGDNTIRVTCSAVAYPSAEVQWSPQPMNVATSNSAGTFEVYASSSFELSRFNCDARQTYTYRVISDFNETSQDITPLEPCVPPTISDVGVITDNNTLRINVTSTPGDPPAMFTWTHQGEPLVNDSRITVNSSSGDLVMEDVQPSDRGVYEVTASNNAGNASITINYMSSSTTETHTLEEGTSHEIYVPIVILVFVTTLALLSFVCCVWLKTRDNRMKLCNMEPHQTTLKFNELDIQTAFITIAESTPSIIMKLEPYDENLSLVKLKHFELQKGPQNNSSGQFIRHEQLKEDTIPDQYMIGVKYTQLEQDSSGQYISGGLTDILSGSISLSPNSHDFSVDDHLSGDEKSIEASSYDLLQQKSEETKAGNYIDIADIKEHGQICLHYGIKSGNLAEDVCSISSVPSYDLEYPESGNPQTTEVNIDKMSYDYEIDGYVH